MRPTIDYIEQRFREFNERYFGGRLPRPEFRLSRARSYLGQLGFKRRRTLLGRTEYYDFVLRISTRLDLPEAEVEDTLLHEMIHLYIASQRLKDTSAHGPLFRQLMEQLNRRHGRHISISHRRTGEDQQQDTQRRTHLICISTFASGERGITVAARSRLFRLWDAMPTFPQVVSTQWLHTTDPYFNRYPRALTPKIYRISPAELDAHLNGARPLVRKGKTVFLG